MVAPFLFSVLTEFKFEIGAALLGTKTLTGAVNNLSSAADGALLSFQKLSSGLTAVTGLGSGSILSVLQASIQAADKYQQTQLSFANLISSNKDHLVGPIETFQDRLQVSAEIMKKISKLGQEFALPTSDLVDLTKVVSAQLIPKGLAGENFGTAIDISRNLLKSSPNLGLNPQDVQGQLLRAIEGGASMGDTLFRRLAGETKAFQGLGGAGGSTTSKFNTMDAQKRVELLSAALKQFASDTDVLYGRVSSLSGQFQRLQQMLSPSEYVTNIFRPLGEVLIPFIVKTLTMVNDMLNTHGRAIIQNISYFIKSFLQEPEKLIVNLLQLRNASHDLKAAGGILSAAGLITGIGHALSFLGITSALAFPALGPIVIALGLLFEVLKRAFPHAATVLKISAGFASLFFLMAKFPFIFIWLAKFAFGLGLLFAALQLISRAVAYAQVADAKELPRITAEFTKQSAILKQTIGNIIAPVTNLFDALAEGISPLFRTSYWLDLLNELMYGLSYDLSILQGAFVGFIDALRAGLEFFTSSSFLTNPTGIFEAMSSTFSENFNRIMQRNLTLGNGADSGNPVTMQNININKVEIRNDFKENAEPDRIAFTVKEQLMKAALNPGQARSRSFAGGLVGA